MKSGLNHFGLILKRYGFYVPFTWYFAVFGGAVWVGNWWLVGQQKGVDSEFGAVFSLLFRFAVYFSMALLGFAFLSVAGSLVYFLWKKKKGGIDFRISTVSAPGTGEGKQAIEIFLHPVVKPFLGFVKLRLKYDKTRFSGKFYLIKPARFAFFNTTLRGTYYWQLPEIKEYRVEKVLLYFEDFFQFFSFAVAVPANSNFYTQPVSASQKMMNAFPRKTEETSSRIEEIKKVEGEHISYKNFESNDDVRRIVWKIYAKNKELVVRIPEILDPYASHVYLYASYFSSFPISGREVIEVAFLNYYKTLCWSVYKQLQGKGLEVRYVPDQAIPSATINQEEEQIKYSISVSKWQRDNELKQYIKSKDASVVIISSLSDIDQVSQLIAQYGNDISFVFVPLTDSLNRQHLGDWLQWLFVQQEKDVVAKYKTNWSLSVMRLKITNNEKLLKQLLEQYDKSTVLQKMR